MSLRPRPTTPPSPEALHTEIHETERLKLIEPLMIVAFPGPGLVGMIGLNQIIQELKLAEIAYLHSHHIPPATVFIDGILHHPFRIYGGLAGRLVAASCELPVHDHGMYPIAYKLLEWAQNKGVREMVVLDGMPMETMPQTHEVSFATEPEESKRLQQKGLSPVRRGVIAGMAGAILNECLVRRMTGIALFTAAPTYIPDPGGADALIRTLNELYSLNVDTSKLLAQEAELKKKLQELSEAYRRQQTEKGADTTPGPTYI